MDKQMISNRLKAYADFLRKTRLALGELEAIERLNGCANSLEQMAKELLEEEKE